MKLGIFKSRWVEIEERMAQITSILEELEELGKQQEEYNIRSTKAYLLYELELELLSAEQMLIEKSGVMGL